MKTFLKIMAAILVLNEVRGVLNVVVNGPRAVMAAASSDYRGLLDIALEMGFIVVLGLAIWAIASTAKRHAAQIEALVDRYLTLELEDRNGR